MKNYLKPTSRVFSSMREYNLDKVAQVAKQQEQDEMAIIVMTAIWAASFKKAPQRVMDQVGDYTDGMVELLLTYSVGKFISSCLVGKRECTFPSLYNWALQMGRGFQGKGTPGIKDWNKNCGKACRSLWKQLPKALKAGKRQEVVELIYSTLNPDMDAVKASIQDRLDFFGNMKGRWAQKMYHEAIEEKLIIDGYLK